MDALGGEALRIADRGYHPCFSPDGSLLYFLSERDGHRCIWARKLDPVPRKPASDPGGLQQSVKLFLRRRLAFISPRISSRGGVGRGHTDEGGVDEAAVVPGVAGDDAGSAAVLLRQP